MPHTMPRQEGAFGRGLAAGPRGEGRTGLDPNVIAKAEPGGAPPFAFLSAIRSGAGTPGLELLRATRRALLPKKTRRRDEGPAGGVPVLRATARGARGGFAPSNVDQYGAPASISARDLRHMCHLTKRWHASANSGHVSPRPWTAVKGPRMPVSRAAGQRGPDTPALLRSAPPGGTRRMHRLSPSSRRAGPVRPD